MMKTIDESNNKKLNKKIKILRSYLSRFTKPIEDLNKDLHELKIKLEDIEFELQTKEELSQKIYSVNIKLYQEIMNELSKLESDKKPLLEEINKKKESLERVEESNQATINKIEEEIDSIKRTEGFKKILL